MLKRLALFALLMVLAGSGVDVLPAQAQQTLEVGSTQPAFDSAFLDTQTNTVQGVMVDLIEAIGKDAGFGVEIEPMQFSTLIPSLTSSKIDIIAAAMFATSQRKEVIDFSDTVRYSYGEGLIVPKFRHQGLRDLRGHEGLHRRRASGHRVRRAAQESLSRR